MCCPRAALLHSNCLAQFVANNGFTSGSQFYEYLKDAFDTLYEEGGRMLSVGLHCRVVGKPGRARALARFLDYVASKPGVWFARRVDIARHWAQEHPPPEPAEAARARDAVEASRRAEIGALEARIRELKSKV